MSACVECGRKVLTQSDRCSFCRNRKNDTDIALRGGRWITRGLIQRYETSSEVPGWSPGAEAGAATPEAQEGRVEPPCQAPRPPAAGRIKAIRFAGRPCCDDCGCLLAHASEPCPACAWNAIDIDWCEQQAVAASWRPIYHKPASEFIAAKNKTIGVPYVHGEMTVSDSGDCPQEGREERVAVAPGSHDHAPEMSGDRETLEGPNSMREVA